MKRLDFKKLRECGQKLKQQKDELEELLEITWKSLLMDEMDEIEKSTS